ncbi:UNVERIFIED_CONTAM: hypothetical protein NCL1_18475 [Trichonephila clavipes]
MADVEKTACCAEPKECCKDESCCQEGKGPCHTEKESCGDSCHKKPCGCKAGEDCKCKDGKCACCCKN